MAQAFSPNPDKPPFYADLPFKLVDGKLFRRNQRISKWRENSPIRMVVKYRKICLNFADYGSIRVMKMSLSLFRYFRRIFIRTNKQRN